MTIPEGVKARVKGKTISVYIPLTLLLAALAYACLASYANNEKIVKMQPELESHLIIDTAQGAAILTKLESIDQRLTRIEALMDANSRNK